MLGTQLKLEERHGFRPDLERERGGLGPLLEHK